MLLTVQKENERVKNKKITSFALDFVLIRNSLSVRCLHGMSLLWYEVASLSSLCIWCCRPGRSKSSWSQVPRVASLVCGKHPRSGHQQGRRLGRVRGIWTSKRHRLKNFLLQALSAWNFWAFMLWDLVIIALQSVGLQQLKWPWRPLSIWKSMLYRRFRIHIGNIRYVTC